jgi:hypothetical protein
MDFVGDRRFIAGLAGALLGLALKYLGIIDEGWLAIVIGLFAAGFLAAHILAPPVPEALRAIPVAELPADLRRLARKLGPQLPPPAQDHLAHILAAAAAMEPRLRTIDAASPSVITVRQIMADYIPTTLRAYAALPLRFRSAPRTVGEPSADDQLTSQLALLEKQMNGLVDTLSRGDMMALEAQGRFLEEKFGSPEIFSTR